MNDGVGVARNQCSVSHFAPLIAFHWSQALAEFRRLTTKPAGWYCDSCAEEARESRREERPDYCSCHRGGYGYRRRYDRYEEDECDCGYEDFCSEDEDADQEFIDDNCECWREKLPGESWEVVELETVRGCGRCRWAAATSTSRPIGHAQRA